MKLRDYQQRTIDEIYKWFELGNDGHPCVVMPTGAGKSHIIAELCKDIIQRWPDQQILMVTGFKEIIEQNLEKILLHWPDAPIGIYSAGMRIKQLGNPITFASIQSIWKKSEEVGHVDVIIVDECHLINHKAEGRYRRFIEKLKVINPNLRVIGFTATPYRLGHGLITDDPALFTAILEPVTMEELLKKGYLMPLHSKRMDEQIDVSGVHKRGGEYIESELQEAVNDPKKNISIVEEIIQRAENRKAWLIFCAGVKHAEDIAVNLNMEGIKAKCVVGDMSKNDREAILEGFKDGEYRAITNANVLTTGFDYPDIDLIAMLRPTLSTGLYVQMAGRGMRIKSHTDHCLVLDFVGNVKEHGPILNVNVPQKKGDGTGEAPVKVCEHCDEYCHLSCRECPSCGHPFPEPESSNKKLKLRDDDIMGLDGTEMKVANWFWAPHKSFNSGKLMVKVIYSSSLSGPEVKEYFPITHEGYAGSKARNAVYTIAYEAFKTHRSMFIPGTKDATEPRELAKLDPAGIARELNRLPHPARIKYKKDGRFFRVIGRSWRESPQ
jgi:DNA repair protein RadD